MMIKRFLLVSALLGASTTALSHSETMTRITGKGISLSTINHSFSGNIGNRLVLGFKKHQAFESQLQIIENDKQTQASFKENENTGVFEGVLSLQDGHQYENHRIQYSHYDKESSELVFLFDGKKRHIAITSEGFEGHHFLNPEYHLSYQGKDYSFKLEEGSACLGYSIHLISMIFPLLIF